jgi:hypothetical protein
MARTTDILSGLALGAFIGVGASFAMSPAPASADAAGVDTPAPLSNMAAKGDLLVTQAPVPVARRVLDQPVEVRQVQVLGEQSASILLLDGDGRVVYRSDPAQRNTTVTKNVNVPSIAPGSAENLTARRIDTAFRAAAGRS